MKNIRKFSLTFDGWNVQEGHHGDQKTSIDKEEEKKINIFPSMEITTNEKLETIQVNKIDDYISVTNNYVYVNKAKQIIKSVKKLNKKYKNYIFFKFENLDDIFYFAGGYNCYHLNNKQIKNKNIYIQNDGIVGATPSNMKFFINQLKNKKFDFPSSIEITVCPRIDYGRVFNPKIFFELI